MLIYCCHCLTITKDDSFITNGLIIPVITSLVATFIVLLFTEFIIPRKKFKKLSGKYIIFWIKDWDKGGDEIDFNAPMGEVEITYKRKNKLEVIHKQNMHDNYTQPIDHQWKGTLVMETSEYGTITFYFTTLWGKTLAENKHRLGFKRVVYDDKRNGKKIIYLFGEDGFGKEVLIEGSIKHPAI